MVWKLRFFLTKPILQSTNLLATASTDGTLSILDAFTGRMVAHKFLPGHVFSSPVVAIDRSRERNTTGPSSTEIGRLFLGCRDDNLYMMRLLKVRNLQLRKNMFESGAWLNCFLNWALLLFVFLVIYDQSLKYIFLHCFFLVKP